MKDNAACAARRSVTRAAGPLQYVLRDDEYLVYSVGRNGDGYLVYSVGPDGTDHGGQGDESGQPDLVFRVQRSAEAKPAATRAVPAIAPE